MDRVLPNELWAMKNLKKMFFRFFFSVLLLLSTKSNWAQFKSIQLFSSKEKVTSEIVFNDSTFTYNVRKWKKHYLDFDIVPVFVGKVVKSDEEITFLLFGKPFLSGILKDARFRIIRLDNFLKLDIVPPEQLDLRIEERRRPSYTRIDTASSFVVCSSASDGLDSLIVMLPLVLGVAACSSEAGSGSFVVAALASSVGT